MQVLNPGKLYFDVKKGSTGFMGEIDAQYTFVQVKILRNNIVFESKKLILYSHLYVKESATC